MSVKFQLNCLLWITAILSSNTGFSQARTPSLPTQSISLDDLTSFQVKKQGNWKIAGSISSNRNTTADLRSEGGKGILVFGKGKGSNMLTSKQQFGDLDLELDFLLAKGSSFGILFRNKYEIQLSDAWMKYGHEAAKAPGLWQHLKVRFKAPAFDPDEKKITNSSFEEIVLNGQTLNIDSEVTITKINAEEDEKADSPFVLVGKNSPFAIRNIQYKTYEKVKLGVSDLTFKVYQGLHKNPDTLKTLKPKRTGVTDTISHRVGDRKSQLVLDGMIDIPLDGDYLFKLTAGGGAWVYIDNQLVINNKGSRDFEKAFYEKTALKKGRLPFKIVYSNSDECLILDYEGPRIPWQTLTTPASIRRSEHFEPLEYKVRTTPAFQRGFMIHRDKVNPYAASVGLPSGTNYAYDMQKFNLLAVWHGRFIDVANMWRERGEKQLAIPLGAQLEFSGKPLIARLIDKQAPWPDSVQASEGIFSSRGYRLNDSGLPIYTYRINDHSVEDQLFASKGGEGITRILRVAALTTNQMYILLAEGKIIEKLPHGGYAIDDKNYYIENLEIDNGEATIRQDKDHQLLLVPVATPNKAITIKYNIIW